VRRGPRRLGSTRRSAARRSRSPLPHHLHGDPSGGLRRPLRRPGLDDEQLSLLEDVLEVLGVAVARLEAVPDVEELLELAAVEGLEAPVLGPRTHLPLAHRVRGPAASDHVLARRVAEVLPVGPTGPGAGIAGEEDAGEAVVAEVAEDHALHDHGGAEICVDAVGLPVLHGPRGVPALEDTPDRQVELGPGVRRRLLPGLLVEEGLVVADQLLDGIRRPALRVAAAGADARLEGVPGHAEDARAPRLEEAAPQIEREGAPVLGLQGLAHRRRQADVEDRRQHARHGHRRPAAHREEQRPVGIAEAEVEARLEDGDALGERGVEARRQLPLLAEGPIELRAQGEAVGDGEPEPGQLRERGALAPEPRASAGRVQGNRGIEGVGANLAIHARTLPRRGAGVSPRPKARTTNGSAPTR
jgi:hypothetical protein